MNYVLVFRPEVREELDDAYNWYQSQQTGLGDEFLDIITKIMINSKLRAIAYYGVKVGNAIAKSINWHYSLKFFE